MRSPNPKTYTGDWVVEHVIKQGQTLDQIARLYALPNWKGIWIYNTQIRRTLTSKSPDLIPERRRILIPRSPQGYDKWLASLQALANDARDIATEAMLDRVQYEAAAQAELWNLAGDVLTMIVSLGAKSVRAARAASAAFDASLVEEAIVNQRLGYVASLLELDEAATGLFDKMDEMLKAAQKALRKAGYEKLFDTSLKLVDKGFAKKYSLIKKLIKAGVEGKAAAGLVTARQKVLAAAGAAADGCIAILDYLDYLKPSTGTQLLMTLFVGESLDTTITNQRDRLKKTEESTRKLIGNHIESAKAEKRRVWGP